MKGESPLIESKDIMECKDNMEIEDEIVNDDTKDLLTDIEETINRHKSIGEETTVDHVDDKETDEDSAFHAADEVLNESNNTMEDLKKTEKR